MISVIIVTYHSRDHIGRCLEALTRCTAKEVIVVDNASQDGTVEFVRQKFPAVHVIENPCNLGFAAGANLGASRSTGAAILFLNPDVVCQDGLAALEEVLEEQRDSVVAMAPRLVDTMGRTQTGFTVRRLPTPAAFIFEILLINRLFPNNPVNRAYRCLDMDYSKPQPVEQPAGACLLVRRTAFEACGGFDESFTPVWFEDVDLCLRLRKRGNILYDPRISFEHAGGHSVETLTFSDRQVYWYRNLLYYVGKHFPWKTGIAIRASLLCGIALRILAELPSAFTGGRARAPRERVWGYLKAAKLSFLGWR
jgi:N-acetylglucosaminyl-diphospho-decaprenol L-rhamnosyltransferase